MQEISWKIATVINIIATLPVCVKKSHYITFIAAKYNQNPWTFPGHLILVGVFPNLCVYVRAPTS